MSYIISNENLSKSAEKLRNIKEDHVAGLQPPEIPLAWGDFFVFQEGCCYRAFEMDCEWAVAPRWAYIGPLRLSVEEAIADVRGRLR